MVPSILISNFLSLSFRIYPMTFLEQTVGLNLEEQETDGPVNWLSRGVS
jgi:hypothetical protein